MPEAPEVGKCLTMSDAGVSVPELANQKLTRKLAMIHAAPRSDRTDVTAMTRLWMRMMPASVGAASAVRVAMSELRGWRSQEDTKTR